jgi:predicted outer membrane repeat protein
MAIEWGGWENHIRVGIDVSWEAISHGETAATATVKIYTDVDQTWSDTQTLNFGGSISGSTTFSNNQTSGSGAALRATKTYTYNYGSNEYGSSPGSRTFTASLSGAYNGATPSKSVTSSIPKRPYGSPAAPTGVTVSRISDTSTKISWTNKDTSGEPWDLVRVQYDVAANDVWNGDIGTPGGGATSFTWNGSVADNAYRFRVRAENSVGDSAYVETSIIYTTPNPPTSPARSGTTTQSLSWAIGADQYISYQTEVWRATNGVWALLATVAQGVTSYSDSTASINNKTKYKFRHKTNGGVQGTLYSAFSAETSETLGVTSPPAAPTSLDPDGIIINPRNAKTFSWVHNPTDSSAQTAFQIQYRVIGAGAWTTMAKVTSSVQSTTIAATTFTDNSSYEWQVRTWGAATTGGSDAAGGSVYSASATFDTVGDPNAARANKRALWLDLETGGMVTAPVGSLAPIGAVLPFAGAATPPGWLLCQGQAVSRSTYADLFGVIGTAFGVGDGSTTFNLPDLRDRAAVGASGSKALGSAGGSATAALAAANIPAHTHSINHDHPSLNIPVQYASTTSTGGTAIRVTDIANSTGGSGTSATATVNILSYSGTSGSTGSGTAFSVQNPYQALNHIIKV